MIDLAAMKGTRVDPGRRTVRAETGVKLGEFDRETQAFGSPLADAFGVMSYVQVQGMFEALFPPGRLI